jgi:hypothetical protein
LIAAGALFSADPTEDLLSEDAVFFDSDLLDGLEQLHNRIKEISIIDIVKDARFSNALLSTMKYLHLKCPMVNVISDQSSPLYMQLMFLNQLHQVAVKIPGRCLSAAVS